MSKKKILVVEDEQALLTLQSMLLSIEGYTVEGVMDGQTALDVVETMKPDLILLDILLQTIRLRRKLPGLSWRDAFLRRWIDLPLFLPF